MRTMVVTANKGGVGKSTIALQVATELARRGDRVLAVDADKQADLTRFAGGQRQEWHGLDAVLRDPPSTLDPRPHIIPMRSGIDLLGSSPRLADVDSAIERGLDEGSFYLQHALSHVDDIYDWAVIDMGHSDELAGNCVVVADVLLMPTTANFPDANHAGDMLHVAAAVREQLHLPKLDLLQHSAIVIWRRQHNGSADAVVIAKLRERYGDLVCPTVIPHSSRVSEANEQHMTVREYAEEYGSRRDKGLHALVDAYALMSEFVTSKVESIEAVAV
jgi:chromosome partitioning protein